MSAGVSGSWALPWSMVVPAKPRSLALLGMTPLRWDGEIELG
jgi:hypothetical protein